MKLFLQFFLLIVCVFTISSCEPGALEDFLDENTECNDFCDSTELSGFFQNHGDCMSLCNTCNNPSNSAATTAVCACNWLETYLGALGLDWADVESETGMKNKGQCVKLLKNNLPSN